MGIFEECVVLVGVVISLLPDQGRGYQPDRYEWGKRASGRVSKRALDSITRDLQPPMERERPTRSWGTGMQGSVTGGPKQKPSHVAHTALLKHNFFRHSFTCTRSENNTCGFGKVSSSKGIVYA
jgi:hypothetical protein